MREDSDLLQIYLVCRYFERRTPPLRAVVDRLARTADKDTFLQAADADISALLESY